MAAILAVLFAGASVGCGPSTEGDEARPVEMVDGGSWYVREPWPHDGRPVESEHFIVYSDAAGQRARQDVAEVAEDEWADLLDEFSVEPGMLQYPEGQDKLHIYAYRNRNPREWAARAYYGGLITWSPDHEERRMPGIQLAPVVKHELVHVLQSLIVGPNPGPVDVWFIEGMCEAAAGGTAGGSIRGLDQLRALTARYGAASPISFKTYSQITSPETGEHFNYPMFQLAVEYLLARDGNGKSPVDARDVLIDVAGGTPFETAFEDRMGISLDVYEREFFDFMEVYLPQHRNPVFSPAGFALLSAVVTALVIGAMILGYRRFGLDAEGRLADGTRSGRVARMGFNSELALAGAIIIVFFLGAMYVVGTANELNNAMYEPVRVRVYLTLTVYLPVSVGILLWAVHRRVHHSRAAFLVAPLIVAATGLATVVLILSLIL